MSFNDSISPVPPSRKDDDDSAQSGAHVPAPVFRDQPKSSDTATRPPTISKSSESSDVGLPGGYPRDPKGALDRMNDKAGATQPSSESGGTFMDAAREDVRHAVDVAASYLPESVVGVFGSVFPVDVIPTEVKKLDPGQASQMGLASSGTSSSLNPSDFAVAGIASEMKFPSRDSAATSNPSDTPSKSVINPKFDPKSGTDAQGKGPLSEGLSKTYAPTNFASASSVDKSSISPDSMPPPGSESETPEGKSKDDDEKKPAFVTYAPAPVITEEYQPSYDEDNNPSATKQFTSPGVASALGSTAPPSKEQASDQPATTGAPEAPGTCEIPAKAKDQKNNNAETASTYAAAPLATDFGSSRVAPVTKDTPAASRFSGKDTRVPGQAASELDPRRSSNAAQNVGESKEALTEDKRKKAIEATALGAGIGTLGGAAYMTSRAPAKDSSSSASQGPTGASSTDSSNDASKTTSGTTAPAVAAPISRDVKGSTATGVPNDRKDPQTGGREAGVGALATGGPAADASDKKAEKDAVKEAKQAEKTHHQREKQAAEATAAAEAAHKKVQKEAKVREEEEKRRVKEAQREQQKSEKEAAATEAARKKAQKDAKEREEKEQRKREKEAKEREEEVRRHEKDVSAAALVGDKQADDRARDQSKQDSKDEKGEQSGKHTGVKALAAGLVPAGLVGASAAEKERGRKAGSSSEAATTSKSESAPTPGSGAPGSNSKAARPGPTALGGTRSDDGEIAKEGADSDFPLPSPSREVGGFMAKKEAIDLDGKGNGARGSAEKAEKVQGRTDDVSANHGSRYRGTEGLQEKHDGGALASSTMSRQEKDHGKRDNETNAGKGGHDHGHGDSEDGKKEGFVKHMVEKVKDKLHHHH